MVDLSKLSPAAVKAAMNGGTEYWGKWASDSAHTRYAEQIVGRKGKCRCGCGKPYTHRGMANGIMLMGGCELAVRRWVRDPKEFYRALIRHRSMGSLVELRKVYGLAG